MVRSLFSQFCFSLDTRRLYFSNCCASFLGGSANAVCCASFLAGSADAVSTACDCCACGGCIGMLSGKLLSALLDTCSIFTRGVNGVGLNALLLVLLPRSANRED